MNDGKLIPDDIRLRMHADMDRIFELAEENANLKTYNASCGEIIAGLNAEIAALKKNQRVRARPSPGGNDNAES